MRKQYERYLKIILTKIELENVKHSNEYYGFSHVGNSYSDICVWTVCLLIIL